MSTHLSLDPDAHRPNEVIRLNQLLRTKATSVDDLAAAVGALRDLASHYHTVPLLLRLSRHRSPLVRECAVHAMACRPLRAIYARLSELEKDPAPAVRAAVKQTGKLLDGIGVLCANGCGAWAKLRAEPSGDPHASTDLVFHAVFCGQACALEWAMDRFRGEVDAGAWHVCIIRHGWTAGSADECTDCEAASLLDDDS